jgi:hypothetical protein
VTLTTWAYRWSPKRTLFGIPTAVLFLTSDKERQTVFSKVEQALFLIQLHAPVRFRQVQRDIGCIFVAGDASTSAQFVRDLRMCEFFIRYVLSPQTSESEIASTLVHEAAHARLFRLRVGANAELHRVEHACYRAERVFCRRLPGEVDLIERATTMMDAEPAMFSAAARVEAQVRALHRLKIPRWFAACGAFWIKRRARRRPIRR